MHINFLLESLKLFRNTCKPILNLFQRSLLGSTMDAVVQHQISDGTDNRKALIAVESLPESRVQSIALNTDSIESTRKCHRIPSNKRKNIEIY